MLVQMIVLCVTEHDIIERLGSLLLLKLRCNLLNQVKISVRVTALLYTFQIHVYNCFINDQIRHRVFKNGSP